MKKFVSVLLATVLVLVSVSAVSAQRFKPGDDTIAEIAIANGNFDILVEALTCTGLAPLFLNPDAEFTVFAPTDTAFQGVLDAFGLASICDLDNELLATVLQYHVVGERRPSPSVINGKNKSIDMLAAGSIFPTGGGALTLTDGAGQTITIVIPDVLASNGIIHAIDTVMLP